MTTLLEHGPLQCDSLFLNRAARCFHPSYPVSPCVSSQRCLYFVANANISRLIYARVRMCKYIHNKTSKLIYSLRLKSVWVKYHTFWTLNALGFYTKVVNAVKSLWFHFSTCSFIFCSLRVIERDRMWKLIWLNGQVLNLCEACFCHWSY